MFADRAGHRRPPDPRHQRGSRRGPLLVRGLLGLVVGMVLGLVLAFAIGHLTFAVTGPDGTTGSGSSPMTTAAR